MKDSFIDLDSVSFDFIALNLPPSLSHSFYIYLDMFPISMPLLSSWEHRKGSCHCFFFVFDPLLWIPHHRFPINHILAPHWVNKFFWHLLRLLRLLPLLQRVVPINIVCQGCAGTGQGWQLPVPAGGPLLPSVPRQWWDEPPFCPLKHLLLIPDWETDVSNPQLYCKGHLKWIPP